MPARLRATTLALLLLSVLPAWAGNGLVAIPNGGHPCPVAPGVDDLRAVVVSPDGAHVYVLGDGLTVWERNPGNGALTHVQSHLEGGGGVTGISSAQQLAIAPDGAAVYVLNTDRLLVWARDAATGTLAFVETKQQGVTGVDGLGPARDLAVSPDSAHVYVAGAASTVPGGSVGVFTRDGGTGTLTQTAIVGGIADFGHAQAVRLSPDGAHVYVGGSR